MAQGQGNQLAHGYPGTPVGDLFPLGQAVLGSRAESSLRPIRAGELRSHSARFHSISVNFSQFLSVLVNFSQFNQTKTQNFFADRKVGHPKRGFRGHKKNFFLPPESPSLVGVSRGNTIRGNRTERF